MSHTVVKADRRFLLYILLITILGLVALTSASTPMGFAKFQDPYFYVKKQIILGLIPGTILFLALARLDYRRWRKLSWVFYASALLLLLLVFVPGVGMTLNGSRSWIGLWGHSFQPSELAKLAIILMAAHLLADPNRRWENWKTGLLPVLAVLAPAFILILFQPDIGTLSILVVILLAMLFLAEIPKRQLAVLGMALAAAFMALMIAAPYRVERLTTFLHPELDPKGVGYHINQAFLAVGSGGFTGLGLGHSRQKFQYLPEVNSDSIFAIVAEETGFIVSSLFVILFLLIGWRGFQIAKAAPDEFGRLTAGGITVWFLWQSFLNIGAMVGALPLTGVPLPFVSHGGSALVVMLAAMGMVAGISRIKY